MNILGIRNFNRYFQKVILATILLSLSLIPWIEFTNSNLGELDFIFNDNLAILIVLYFLFISIFYLILKYFSALKEYSLVAFVLISIWTLFQHNFIKSSLDIFFKNINISSIFSSEIALIIILLFIFLFL